MYEGGLQGVGIPQPADILIQSPTMDSGLFVLSVMCTIPIYLEPTYMGNLNENMTGLEREKSPRSADVQGLRRA